MTWQIQNINRAKIFINLSVYILCCSVVSHLTANLQEPGSSPAGDFIIVDLHQVYKFHIFPKKISFIIKLNTLYK